MTVRHHRFTINFIPQDIALGGQFDDTQFSCPWSDHPFRKFCPKYSIITVIACGYRKANAKPKILLPYYFTVAVCFTNPEATLVVIGACQGNLPGKDEISFNGFDHIMGPVTGKPVILPRVLLVVFSSIDHGPVGQGRRGGDHGEKKECNGE